MIDVEQFVVSEEESATHRKVINVPRASVEEVLVQMYEDCSEASFTGKWTVNFVQGGIANIVTEHVKSGLEGLFDGDEEENTAEVEI